MSQPHRNADAHPFAIDSLSGHLGARLADIDLNHIDEHDVESIRQALHHHLVLCFPKQALSGDALVRFAELFGEVQPPHGGLQAHSINPKVMVTERKAGGGVRNDMWHSDVSFDVAPPSISILQAIEVPDTGGDTMFASMYAAYEELSAPLRTAVESLQALHDGLPGFTYQLAETPSAQARLQRLREEAKTAVHPVVRRHPATGKKALYVNRLFTQRIMGLSDLESRNLLNLLCEHAEQSSFQVRWRWSEGDVVMWDNRCVMHYAANDIGDADRTMWRVTLTGEQPTS